MSNWKIRLKEAKDSLKVVNEGIERHTVSIQESTTLISTPYINRDIRHAAETMAEVSLKIIDNYKKEKVELEDRIRDLQVMEYANEPR